MQVEIKKTDWRYLALFTLSCTLLTLMISGDSIWIDEAYNARFAKLYGWNDFVKIFLQDHRSENQMPFGMFFSWICGSIFGTSELSLRGINIIWGITAIWAFYRIGKNSRTPWLPLFLSIQPFFWFYMNEARPYAMQIAGGSLLMLFLLGISLDPRNEKGWLPAYLTGGGILCGSSLLGVIPFSAFSIVALALLIKKRYIPSRLALIVLSIFFVILLSLGVFYYWTIIEGAGGAKIWKVGVLNPAFVMYDFLGFGGLGPPRSDLRAMARGLIGINEFSLKRMVPVVALSGIYIVVVARLIRKKVFSDSFLCAVTGVFVGSGAMLLIASLKMGFPFWGRHLAAVFPALVLLIAISCSEKPSAGIRKNLLLFMLSGILIYSSLQQRFSPFYKKDDYRGAAELARKVVAGGGVVWWAADDQAAVYYGLKFVTKNNFKKSKESELYEDPNSLYLVSGTNAVDFDQVPPASMVILSKPDIYDSSGRLRQWMEYHGTWKKKSMTSFNVFEK
jgi:hypothetical protein